MAKSSEQKKKNYLKNYIILIIVFGLCVGFTLYLCEWYKVYNEYLKETPVIRGSVSEIGYEDLDHYVVDVPNVVIYLCTSNSDSCRSFEKNFKKYIKKNELGEEIVYLNLTGVDQEKFIEEFNNKYNYKIKLNGNFPAFVSFRDGKVDAILQGSSKKQITLSKVDDFLDVNIYDEGE